MSYTRKRVALACVFCRSRKRRCDARRPSCSNCIDLDVQCHYDDAPSQRIDSSGGSREILNRLQSIETLLEEQSERLSALSADPRNRHSFHAHNDSTPQSQQTLAAMEIQPQSWPNSRLDGQSDYSSLPPLTIPIKHKTSSTYLLTLPSVKALIGDYPTDLFFKLESRSQPPPQLSMEQAVPSVPFRIQREITDQLVSVFFSIVHPNHPILDPKDFNASYESFLNTGFDYNLESILCMVVLALGAVAAASPDSEVFKTSPPGMEYMQYAMPKLLSLSAWSFSSNMLAAQALVLASVYFAYIVRPLQSWRLIYSASTLLQINRVGIDSLQKVSSDLKDEEYLARLFWSCFLVECDRLAELELPRSGLQELTDNICLPSCTNLGLLESTQYLAEISIRRLLNRIHNSLYPGKRHALSQPSITALASDDFSVEEIASIEPICNELRSQLELWYSSIPEAFRPNIEEPSTGHHADRETILKIRYFAARHIIYRPFLICIVTHSSDRMPQSVIEKASLCIESCRWYLHLTTQVLAKPSQYTWTFALSSLGAVIILTLASLNRDLQDYVPDIDELQTMATNNFRPWAFSSLEAVVSILEDIQKKHRILLRV